MCELDETDLIAFFGVPAEHRETEETEFFATLAFVKCVGQFKIEIALHRNHRDVSVTVGHLYEGDHSVFYSLMDYESLRIEPDKAGRSWLRVHSGRGDELGVSVEPTILVRVTGSQAAT